MKKIFNPKYLLLFTTVPYLLLSVILAFSYGPNLYPLALIIGVSAFVYIIFYMRDKYLEIPEKKSFVYIVIFSAIVTAVCFICFIYDWDFERAVLIFIAFSSIPPLYGMFGIGLYTVINNQNKQNLSAYVTGLLGVPVIMLVTVAISVSTNLYPIVLIFIVVAYYIIVFLIIHIILIKKHQAGVKPEQSENNLNDEKPKRNYILTTAILGLFMPITGLLMNYAFNTSGGLFGDFSSPIFYIIAAVNGILLLIKNPDNKYLRLLFFFLKSVGYTYVLYFFIVFLPVLPIGIFALLLIIGIYAFAPAALAFWQGRILLCEFKTLKKIFNKWVLVYVFAAGLITLPLCLYISILDDNRNMMNAVSYISDINADAKVNISELERTLTIIEGGYHISQNVVMIDYGYAKGATPLLSGLYSKIVLDGKTISPDNLLLLKSIFLDKGYIIQENSNKSPVQNIVALSDISISTTYDASAGAYRTWVELELQNNEINNAEYVARFDLPEGAFITNYYLDVYNERKYGILSDRRAALFIYNKIVSKAKDPGIIHYIDENRLELKVFPFVPNELRKTGFEILHQEGFGFIFDNNIIQVEGGKFDTMVLEGATLLSAAHISEMPKVNREPEYYFIVDCSENSDIKWLTERLSIYAGKNGISEADVYFASYKIVRSSIENMAADIKKIEKKGGYNFNLAAKSILNSVTPGKYPVIIAVTDNIYDAVLPYNISIYMESYPEIEHYYLLNHQNNLEAYNFLNNQRQYLNEFITPPDIVSYNGMYIVNDGGSKLLLTGKVTSYGKTLYEDAVLLKAEHKYNLLNGDMYSTNYIRKSFLLGVLSPQTAFIVLETAEQEAELLALQEKILNQDFNIESPSQSLSEPPVYILLLGCLILILIKKFKEERKNELRL